VKRQHLLPFFVLSLMVTYDKYAPTKLKTRALQLLPFDNKYFIVITTELLSFFFVFALITTQDKYAPTKPKIRALQLLPFDDNLRFTSLLIVA
jgi:hypothetical protein